MTGYRLFISQISVLLLYSGNMFKHDLAIQYNFISARYKNKDVTFLTSGKAVVTTFFHERGFFYPPSKYCFVPVDL